MSRKIKNAVSILLALVMLCGVLAVAPVAVGATVTTYTAGGGTGGKYTFNTETGELHLLSEQNGGTGVFNGEAWQKAEFISWKDSESTWTVSSDKDPRIDNPELIISVTADDDVVFTGDCSYMFHHNFTKCKTIDLHNVNTENVTNMKGMFRDIPELTSLNISDFNTEKVTIGMVGMFQDCPGLKSLNVSSFNTVNIDSFVNMFRNCSSLESLDLSSFTINTNSVDSLLNGTSSLKELTISDKFGQLKGLMYLNNGVKLNSTQWAGWRIKGASIKPDPRDNNVTGYANGAAIINPDYLPGVGETKTYIWINYYGVDWVNWDGTKLSTECYTAESTDSPTYKGATPTRPDSDGKTYTFDGWVDDLGNTFDKNADLPAVTRDTTYTAKFTEVPKKFFAAHSLTLDGDIGVNFFIDVTAAGITPQDILSGDSTLTLDFSWDTDPAPITDVSKDSITLSKSNASRYYNEDNGYFKIKCNVAAAEMACKIKADGIVAGAKDYTESETYSVRDYGMSVINNPSKYSETLVDLAKKMLDYGAKAQKVFNIIPDDLANKDVTGYTMTNVTASDIQAAIEAEPANKEKTASDMASGTSDFGLRYASSTVVYLTKSTLRHYYYIDDQGKYDNVKAKFNERKLPVAVYIEYSDIAAADLDKLQTFAIDSTHTYYYSALNYAKDVIGSNSSKDENKKLAMAMYWYNQAANAYFK